MKPPNVVYIGANDYTVSLKKNMTMFGETDNLNSAITLHVKQSQSSLRDTFLHEVMHAIVFASGAHKTLDLTHDSEEELVVTLTPWILAVLRDNPKLVEFLLENREREY